MIYPQINPVLIDIGPVSIHWYGFMYLVGFLGGWILAQRRGKQAIPPWSRQQVDDLLFYCALGVILGGRIGYTLFYNFGYWLNDPTSLFKIWQGGMSFHGGFLGVLLSMWFFSRKTGFGFFQITDFIAPLFPIGIFAGRLGNFINGELWGRPTDLPWAMQVPCQQFQDLCINKLNLHSSTELTPPLHPSQLYEAALEGVLLFIVLWLFSARPRPVMAVSALFLLGYGLSRFAVEFVRMPDAHIGYLYGDWLTQGQLLTLPMIVFGVILLIISYKKQPQKAA